MPRTISPAGDRRGESWEFPVEGIAYGGDYNPEQWSEDVWLEDARLMQIAGVNLVSVGIFSWGLIELEDGVFRFDWLDRVFEILRDHGIVVNLATPTAAPPIWLLQKHPEITTVSATGVRLS